MTSSAQALHATNGLASPRSGLVMASGHVIRFPAGLQWMRDGDMVHKFLFVGGVLALMVGLVLVFDGHCGGLMG